MIPANKPMKHDSTKGLNVFLIGEPNVGKTTFAASFPNALILNTDGNLQEFDTPAMHISGWKYHNPKTGLKTPPKNECFCNIVDDLVDNDHPFDTIVVEVVSAITKICRDYVMKRLELKYDKLDDFAHESDLEYSKGWDIMTQVWLTPLSKLLLSRYNVILITHSVAKIKTERGNEIHLGNVPDIRPRYSTIVSGYCHITGELTRKHDRKTNKSTNVLKLNSTKNDELTSNKLNIREDLVIEQGYEYDDLCDLIEKHSKLKLKGE